MIYSFPGELLEICKAFELGAKQKSYESKRLQTG